MQSVLTEDMEHCYICGLNRVEIHHIMFGNANRVKSDEDGYVIPLCREHHTGNEGVHHNRQLDINLKKIAQIHYESHRGSRDDFRARYGKSWL